MQSNYDDLISVPLEAKDVSETVSKLPRHPDDAEIVAVHLKRMLKLKNVHLKEYIRPAIIIKALKTLKAMGNPHYQDVCIDEEFLNKPETPEQELANRNVPEEVANLERELDEEFERNQENSDDENDSRLRSVKNYQSKQNSNTCLYPRDMSSEIVVNEGRSILNQQSITNEKGKCIQIAPGIN